MKKILFLTGTRADFGKMKPLMRAVDSDPTFECTVFVTGMHMLKQYGLTVNEVCKAGFKKIFMYMNQVQGERMDVVLANTIIGFSRYINEYQPDMVVVHGDRVETLAGAIVGAMNNILVAHIEGGELSGTIDGLIRHSVSKLSHLHFVSNNEAAYRLRQLGEDTDTIHVIGSPDVDIMLSENLPSITEVKRYYEIDFDRYYIVTFHPVTTEIESIYENTCNLVNALVESGKNYVIIYPNNDIGSDEILRAYKRVKNNKRFRIFPSLRFEYFLTLLKHAKCMIGNSSAVVREAPIYGIYSINIGTRQQNRFSYKSILNVGYRKSEILDTINSIDCLPICEPCFEFGRGESAHKFIDVLKGDKIWRTNKQKQFIDVIKLKTLSSSV
ncbi:MAG: UDP-N-acetylglucosamine 2-epimerase (hydrolyzing) [Syntrophomonadaceae bacterium]|nr:UDP-N-acetylglucosamine 2-epimerase (hydrolyzing) [Syntrophomonadaceae bacterium]